ncbi:MAG TPA: YihY/virulence factor BrkB family protein [Caulobacteraceae bacterium]|jgi:membrane protein|nr:YihY/virulence factor BrkB family protein [Caulobacteraceae bacterium]
MSGGVGKARFDRLTALAFGLLLGLAAPAVDSWLARRGDWEGAPGVSGVMPSSPLKIDPEGWRQVLVRTVKAFNADQIPSVAAGVTFFALLALFPAIGAFVSLYGLVGDVDAAERQLAQMAGFLPDGAIAVVGDQITRLIAMDHGRLGLTFIIGLAVSIWSANAGVKALISGLNAAYEKRETRGFIALNLLSLSFTFGVVLFAVAAATAAVAAPTLLAALGLEQLESLTWLRWPILLAAMVALLSVLYRYGPCRHPVRWRWITPGGLAAALAWLAMSLGFSWYVGHFGHYNRTYGSLGAVIGFMTWIWLSVTVVLFGAELNSEVEKQRIDRSRTARAARAALANR